MAILHNKVALGTGVVAIPSVSLVSLWRRCMVGSSWNKVAFITKNELDKGFFVKLFTQEVVLRDAANDDGWVCW